MNLRRFTTGSLIFLTLVVVLVQLLVSDSIVRSGFEELEEREVAANLRRVSMALQEQIENLDIFLWDWTSWDDTYAFVQDGNEAYVESNLAEETFHKQELAAIVFWNKDGQVVFGQAYDLEEQPDPELLRALLQTLEKCELPFIGQGEERGRGGLLLLSQGAFFVASRPALTTQGEGPPMGRMLMMRRLSEDRIESLGRRLELDLRLETVGIGLDLPLDAPVVLSLLDQPEDGARIEDVGTLQIRGRMLFVDVTGQPALLATVTQERGIMQLGKRYAAYNLAFLAAVVVAYSLFAYFLLRTRVLARIESLGRQLRRFDPRAEVSLRMKMSGDDEIAELAANVNAMLCKIDESRREIEEQHTRIKENERFLNQLFNSIKAGIMLVDAEERTIVDINDFALRMIGREYRDVVGRVCHKFTSPSEAGQCPILDLHQEQDFSTRGLITADHGLIPIMKSVAFVEKDGRRLLLETFIDISELEQMRRQVEQARDELEQKVQERTRELAEANRELQALDQARTLFLSSASHELRTPLTSVMGFLKLMERSFSKNFVPLLEEHADVKPKVTQHLDNLAVVRSEATRLGRLVNDLLDLNKIESGSMQWRDAPVTVQELLHDARDLAAGLLEARPGVTLAVDMQPDLPQLCVDRDRIHQVLNNLVSNAVKFTDQGRIVLAARSRDTLVEISVRDTGTGIPANDHQHVFDLFYQSQDYDNRSANPLGTGTGLGLAISRNIVQHYGGEIWVESEPGKGSTFFFTLPVA